MNPLLLIFPVIGIVAGVIVALIDKVSASICMEEARRGRGRCERDVESESQHTVVADSFSEIKGGSALTKCLPRND